MGEDEKGGRDCDGTEEVRINKGNGTKRRNQTRKIREAQHTRIVKEDSLNKSITRKEK